MYYIQQKQGGLTDAAKRFQALVKENRFEEAATVYQETTGEAMPTNDKTWMQYCGAGCIRKASGLTVKDWQSISDAGWIAGYDRAREAARIAQQRRGGVWEVVYEY